MLGLGFQPQIEALRALLLPPAGSAAAGQGEEGGKAAKKKRAVQVGRPGRQGVVVVCGEGANIVAKLLGQRNPRAACG